MWSLIGVLGLFDWRCGDRCRFWMEKWCLGVVLFGKWLLGVVRLVKCLLDISVFLIGVVEIGPAFGWRSGGTSSLTDE